MLDSVQVMDVFDRIKLGIGGFILICLVLWLLGRIYMAWEDEIDWLCGLGAVVLFCLACAFIAIMAIGFFFYTIGSFVAWLT